MKPKLIACCIVIAASQSFAQTTTTGEITTLGKCSPVVIQPKGKVEITCDGAGLTPAQAEKQAKEYAEILSTIRKNSLSFDVVIGKLNDMQADISKIKDSTAARHLTRDQQAKLAEVAKAYPEQTINIAINWGDSESADYALQFIQQFKLGNWKFFAGGNGYGQATYTPPIHGLVFLVNPADEENHHVPDHCVALFNTLSDLLLNPMAEPNQTVPVGQCRFVVGVK